MAVVAVAAVGLLSVGCNNTLLGVSDNETERSDAFLAVERDSIDSESSALTQALGAQANVKGQVTGNNFYLAIHKSQLGKKFFLSSYMRQFYPDPGASWASLGTRVVSFQVQNGQLVMFDVDNRKKMSDTFDPQVIVDAFPVIENFEPFKKTAGWKNYVLFNPAAGKNEFSVLGDMGPMNHGGSWDDEGAGAPLKLQVSFLQRYRSIADGVTFEKVFAGTLTESNGTLRNYGGTLGIGLREYKESEGFTTMAMPAAPHYFAAQTMRVASPGYFDEPFFTPAARWNIKEGMQPIQWLISDQLVQLQKDPQYAAYDLVGAATKGIEGWNKAFGFKVFEAKVASPEDSQANDDQNFIVFDNDTSLGYAFANWRTNPNTGEIRGASVYFSKLWVEIADLIFRDPPPAGNGNGGGVVPTARMNQLMAQVDAARPGRTGLRWVNAADNTLCNLWVGDAIRVAAEASADAAAADAPLSKKEQVERYITHLLLHEVGHTLGLRHNFKGSLMPASSSVMDYLQDADSLQSIEPGAYDVDAMKYLYLGAKDLPAQPFCTDEHVAPPVPMAMDPLCNRFDTGTDPLRKQYGPLWEASKARFLSTGAPLRTSTLGQVLRYVWGGSNNPDETKLEAFAMAMKDVGVPVDAAKVGSDPVKAARADAAAIQILTALMKPASGYLPAKNLQPVVDQLKGIVQNDDGIRVMETRRTAVDLLKLHQSDAALAALLSARATVNSQIAAAPEMQKALLEDLTKRIDKATDSYFVK